MFAAFPLFMLPSIDPVTVNLTQTVGGEPILRITLSVGRIRNDKSALADERSHPRTRVPIIRTQ